MKKTALILAYVAAFLAMGKFSAPTQAVVSAVAALLFALAFRRWASGSATAVVLVIFLLTIVFPVAGLLFIGLPVYDSWIETLRVAVNASREHGMLGGVEWFVPLICGCAGLAITSRLRTVGPAKSGSHERERSP